MRAIASSPRSAYPDVDDPLARTLLPAPIHLLADLAKLPLASSLARPLTFGLLDHIALRTAAIDDAIRESVQAGVGQLVVLGAGLDARAYRMPELREVRVFEVDH